MDEILTVKEVAKYLKIKPVTIYKMLKEKKLPGVKIGGLWRIKTLILNQWITWCNEHTNIKFITEENNGEEKE